MDDMEVYRTLFGLTGLGPAAQALARQIADKAPIALRYAKEAVVGGLGLPLADGIRLENDLATLLRTTEDRVEGAEAFVEKRCDKADPGGRPLGRGGR
jgi:enoyl-CoA hydratase